MGLYVVFALYHGFADEFDTALRTLGIQALLLPSVGSYGNWFANSLLAALAVMMVPRQF